MYKKTFAIKKIILIWLLFLSFFVVYYLYKKHSAGNDSSISEWLINYKGGFTRRGLGGELAIIISKKLAINLRFSIFIIQSSLHLLYFLIFYCLIKDLKLNILQIFSLFTPVLLLFPIAEIESLGRKEIILFCFFAFIIYFANKKFSLKINNFLLILILPLIILIWEQVVLFCPFILCVIIFSRNQKTFSEIFFKNILLFLPSILTFLYVYINPLDKSGHKIMCEYLLNYFGEGCYMSAVMLVTHGIHFDTFYGFHKDANFINYLRYLIIFFISFLPLHLLLIKNKFIFSKNFISLKLKPINLFFILYIPILLLFIFGLDWGRWITITYTYAFLSYLFLIKNNFITQKIYTNQFLKKNFYSNKKIILIVLIIFAFTWNQKTTLLEDIGSIPVYRIMQKAIKWDIISKYQIHF